MSEKESEVAMCTCRGISHVCVSCCRVKEKAYRELNDSDGRPDEVVASEAWNYHLSRNQSVIVDLFHGQVQRSLVTPCQSLLSCLSAASSSQL